MALAERAELVARLSLKDDFSRRVGAVQKNFSTSMGKIQKTAVQGARNTATNVAKIGAIGLTAVTGAVIAGVNSLVELESATTSVDGAIKQMGQTGKVTSQQIAGWANEIEAATQAAFDDKEITAAATTLIRYGKVAPGSLKQTLTVMTDLAAKTGSVDSAASKLAKALADPTKASRVLREVGVTLTKQQEDQIKKWVKAGDLAKAQALILGEVEDATKGAAASMNGPMKDAQLTLRDTWEDVTRVLSTGALPVLKEVQEMLTEELAKPDTLKRVKEFGEGLADGFRSLIKVAKNIPWDTIGSSLKIAGTGAKAVFDAFTGLPPWVQTAVLTSWGLNKLSGGALGTIVGELGKGLIRGVLGMTAGVVNIKAGTVVGGGVPGVGGGGKGGGALAFLGMAGLAAAIGGLVGTVISDVWTQLDPNITVHRDENGKPVTQNRATHERKPVGAQPFDGMLNRPLRVYGKVEDQRGAVKWERIAKNTAATTERTSKVTTALRDHKAAVLGKLERDIDATRTAGARSKAATERMRGALSQKMANVAAAERGSASRIVTAIRNSRPIVNVRVTSNTIRVQTTGGTVSRNINPNYMKAGTG
jgi:hypothetical protein